MSQGASARRPASSVGGGRKRHAPSIPAFLSFLKAHDAGHFSEALLNNGFTLENLENLTSRDCRQLRITNPRDIEKLLGLASVARELMRPAAVQPPSAAEADTSAREEHAAAASPKGTSPAPPPEEPDAAVDPDAEGTPRRQVFVAGDGVYTASLPTSNERCRQATVYFEHHSVDRPWPRPGSALARSLTLSTATPHSGSHTLYTLSGTTPRQPAVGQSGSERATAQPPANGPSMTGRRPKSSSGKRDWKPTTENKDRWRLPSRSPRDGRGIFGDAPPMPTAATTAKFFANESMAPHPETDPESVAEGLRAPPTAVPRCNVHSHGRSAAFCHVCEEQVKEATMQGHGQWQYQSRRSVTTGIDSSETVNVWEPFDPMECLVLEHANRQRKARVRLGKHMADFPTMQWGPHKIRRVANSAVPFPTLRQRDLEHPPPLDPVAETALQKDLDESFRRLIVAEEERARFYLYHTQGRDLDIVLAEIADLMDQLHERQRAELEAEEEAARKAVFEENFELALDDIWAEAEKKAVDVQLTGVRRSSENIVLKQQDIIAKMEEMARDKIILEERAARANLAKLLARFNTQVRSLLKRSNAPVANTTLRCKYCRQLNCTFFHAPWQNHWRHQGPEYRPEELPERVTSPIRRPPTSAAKRARRWAKDKKKKKVSDLDEDSDGDSGPDARDQVFDRRPLRPRVDQPLAAPYVHPAGFRDVAELIGKAKEVEYEEYLKDKARHKIDARGNSPQHHLEAPSSPAITNGAAEVPSFDVENAAAAASGGGQRIPVPPPSRSENHNTGRAHAKTARTDQGQAAQRPRPGSVSPRGRPAFRP